MVILYICPLIPLPTTSKEVHPLGLSMSSTMLCHASTEGGGVGGLTSAGVGCGGLTPLGKPWSGNDARGALDDQSPTLATRREKAEAVSRETNDPPFIRRLRLLDQGVAADPPAWTARGQQARAMVASIQMCACTLCILICVSPLDPVKKPLNKKQKRARVRPRDFRV